MLSNRLVGCFSAFTAEVVDDVLDGREFRSVVDEVNEEVFEQGSVAHTMPLDDVLEQNSVF